MTQRTPKTADTDSTVTAQINATYGQTEMAIFAVPSTQTMVGYNYYASAIKSGSATSAEVDVKVCPFPESQPGVFIKRHDTGLTTDGTNYVHHTFDVPYAQPGPAIVKIVANASANNTDISAGFDLIVINN